MTGRHFGAINEKVDIAFSWLWERPRSTAQANRPHRTMAGHGRNQTVYGQLNITRH
jgi:hypothetical protein